MAKACLALVRDIADGGASSWSADHVGFVLQDLTQVLLEFAWTNDARFPPIWVWEMAVLSSLHLELQSMDQFSQGLAESDSH
jgi:hypothetical protein